MFPVIFFGGWVILIQIGRSLLRLPIFGDTEVAEKES
jgi:hypothetical protein